MLKTKPNGADAIFRKIFDTVNHDESHVNIILFHQNNGIENWSFGSDNFSHFETSGSVLEGRLQSGELNRAVVSIRERKNGKNLLFRILFTKEHTHFLSAEESMYSDTTDAITKEENALPLQEGHIYLDADFFSDDENQYFKNIECLSMDNIMFQDEKLDPSPFAAVTQNDLDFYDLEKVDNLTTLDEKFFFSVYGKRSSHLDFVKQKIKTVLNTAPFKNKQNSYVAKNIDSYINILNDIGMDLEFTVMFTPLFNRLRFVSREGDTVFQVEIFFKDNLIRIYGLEVSEEDEDSEEISYTCSFIEESKLDFDSLIELTEKIEAYLISIESSGIYEEDLDKYGVEDDTSYFELEDDFFVKLYPDLNQNEGMTLIQKEDDFKKLLVSEPFLNEDNKNILNDFENYKDLFKEIGLYDTKDIYYCLPPFEEFKLSIGFPYTGIHLTFHINVVTVEFFFEVNEEILQTQVYSLDDSEDMEHLKGIINQC